MLLTFFSPCAIINQNPYTKIKGGVLVFCPKCGRQYNMRQPYCPYCGSPTPSQQNVQQNNYYYRSYNVPQPQYNPLCIAGFVCSFLIAIVGLILSIIGMNQVKISGEKGYELAMAGIIISAVSMFIAFVYGVYAFRFFGALI